MKNKILMFTATGVMLATSLTSYSQQNKKAEKARKDQIEAKEDLKEAKTDSIADFEKFKKEAEIKIADNQKKIDALKVKKAESNKDTKEKYDKKVVALEEKNNALKNKIDGYSNSKTSSWTSFKREFNHDMSELGRAFKDVGVDNMK